MRELTIQEMDAVDGAWDMNEVSMAAYGLSAVAGTMAVWSSGVPLAAGSLAATGLTLYGIGAGAEYLYTYY